MSSMISEEERLIYRLFPGYLRSERSKETGSWIWGYGHDIQKAQGSSVTRRWVCKPYVEQKRVRVGAYESNGINNMKNHLFEEHKIRAPAGESKGSQERRADEVEGRKHGHSLTSRSPSQKSMQQALGLDASKDRERNIYDTCLSTRLSWWLRELQQRDLKPGKKPLKVIRDYDTRCLSQFHMIRRALELRRYFDLLMVEYWAEWKSAKPASSI